MGDSRLQLEGLLKDLRDNSVDGQAGLKQLHDFLFTQHSTSTDHGVLHWFCNKVVDPLVPEAATFLLRLHAYDSPKVEVWREKLQIVLGGCVGCAKRLEEVNESSTTT
jgi:senataxin